jgi:hypothetical protein
MKIRPLGAELFQAYGRTDITKLMVAFPNFAKARNKMCNCNISYLLVTFSDMKVGV